MKGRSLILQNRLPILPTLSAKLDEGDILYCSCQEREQKTFIFYKNNNLENWFDCGNIPPFESLYGFASDSTNLSPTTNSESQRYHYPVCHTLVATQHPLSRFQSSARGPALSRTRSPMSLYVGSRALSSKMTSVFIRRLDKPD
jgi:hypothetical protein